MTAESSPQKYPDAISRNFSEGGYTFLHRIFRKNIDSGKPVVTSTGKLYFQYQYSPEHTTFEQGISLLVGDPRDETKELFMEVVRSFGLDVAISEGEYSKQADGSLIKTAPTSSAQTS